MSGPSSAEAAIRVAVRRALPDPPAVVLVACSGGPDSLALAAATAFEARGRGIRAGAVVVDHGIQPGSDAVARLAADQCRALGLGPVMIKSFVIEAGPNLEARARDARYEALGEAAGELGAAAVLLGHTLDDQAESVLLALARGSGSRALSAIPPRRGVYRRPLLAIRRAETIEACEEAGLVVWDDPMNRPGGPHRSLRAEVRATVIPVLVEVLGDGAVLGLARSAELARADSEALDRLAEDAEVRAVIGGEVLVAQLEHELSAVRRRVLRRAAVAWGAGPGSLTVRHIDALDSLISDWHGQGPVSLPDGIDAVRTCGKLVARPRVR
ncbi:MAG: tRNA lysidine(34) synthetase TilS [Bifidobacteriaceae bacterium]|jgi:tRNA(Ile)-lysidine synthase|nr:tRNA lysidine(34) synthetase TilS [Bifidobacteriaceae bacterium]